MDEIIRGNISLEEPLDSNSMNYCNSIRAAAVIFPTVASVVQFNNQRDQEAALRKLPVYRACFPHPWKDIFDSICTSVRLEESCSSIMKAMNHGYDAVNHQSDESEIQLITVIDACLHLFNIIMRRNHQRNSAGSYTPRYSNEYKETFLLIVGEEKLRNDYLPNTMGNDPKLDLLSKIPFSCWADFYGKIPFIFGYYAIGDSTVNRINFGLIHPENGNGEHFTSLYEGDILSSFQRGKFIAFLLKIIPVFLELMRVADSQKLVVQKGLVWRHNSARAGICKTVSVVVIEGTPVVEISWTPLGGNCDLFHSKMEMIIRVFDILGKRAREHSYRLHYHPTHRSIQAVGDMRS
jgi:hypothetical protein